jgi:membrane protein YqaA with SNARE-associated domain
MDVFTILLASAHRDWWPYYGFMATAGAVLGGYITYRLAEKGGEETLERKVGKPRAGKVYQRFEKKGFQTVMIGAVLPPPFPIVPFLMAAGVLQYPRNKFLGALALGRGMRYFALAYLGHIYGQAIIGFFARYEQPVLYSLIVLAVLGAMAALLYFKYYRPKRRRQEKQRGEPVEEFPIPGRGNQELKEKDESKRRTA